MRQIILDPGAPTISNIVEGFDGVELNWNPPNGSVDCYTLWYKETENDAKGKKIEDIKQHRFCLKDLTAGSTYCGTLVAVSGTQESKEENWTSKTGKTHAIYCYFILQSTCLSIISTLYITKGTDHSVESKFWRVFLLS